MVPSTRTAQAKHLSQAEGALVLTGKGFSPDGLYQLLTTTLLRIADDVTLALNEAEREVLRQSAPHTLRHTFATHAVANEMPTDVLQRLLVMPRCKRPRCMFAPSARGLAAVAKMYSDPR